MDQTDAVLTAIAQPTRRAIVQLVGRREMAAGEIAEHFAVTRPAVSQHLAVLKEVGLLVERREGTRRLYRLDPDGLEGLRAFLSEVWPNALERFKAAAESTAAANTETASPRRAHLPDKNAEGMSG